MILNPMNSYSISWGIPEVFILMPTNNGSSKATNPIKVTSGLPVIAPPVPRVGDGVLSMQSKVLAGFTLLDGNGIIYEFGMDDSAIESSVNFSIRTPIIGLLRAGI